MAENKQNMSSKEKKKKLFVRIMAWFLSILMAGSVATLAITMIIDLLAH